MPEIPPRRPERDGWREPTSLLPRRWGGYRTRYLTGLSLLLVGGLLIQATSAYTEYFLSAGAAAHLLGWWLVPGRGWRRLWMSILSVFVMLLLLTGGPSPAALVIPLAGWLYLRQRPARSYIVLVLPLLVGILLGQLFPHYGSGAIVVSVAGAVVVGSAWIARVLAKAKQTPSSQEAPSQ